MPGKIKFLKNNKFFLLILFILTLFIWAFAWQTPDNNLHLYFFDVGQGDSILIQKKTYQVLIDGGPDNKVLTGLGRSMPFYDRKIEYIILTHPHADHITGLIEVIKRYEVGRIYLTDATHTTNEYLEFLQAIKDKNIPIEYALEGKKINLDNSIVLNILYPNRSFKEIKEQNLNNTSIITRLEYFNFSTILSGDAESIILDSISKKYSKSISSDVIKIPHHGSQNALNYNFLLNVSPELAVISAGKDNQFGHPSQKVLDTLKNINTFRTDISGQIEVITDGHKFWIKTEK